MVTASIFSHTDKQGEKSKGIDRNKEGNKKFHSRGQTFMHGEDNVAVYLTKKRIRLLQPISSRRGFSITF